MTSGQEQSVFPQSWVTDTSSASSLSAKQHLSDVRPLWFIDRFEANRNCPAARRSRWNVSERDCSFLWTTTTTIFLSFYFLFAPKHSFENCCPFLTWNRTSVSALKSLVCVCCNISAIWASHEWNDFLQSTQCIEFSLCLARLAI